MSRVDGAAVLEDKIKLAALGIRHPATLRADIENVAGGSLIDLSADHGLTIFPRGGAQADLDGQDFVLRTTGAGPSAARSIAGTEERSAHPAGA